MLFVPVCSTAVVPVVSVPTVVKGERPVLLWTRYPTTPVEGDGAHDRSTAPPWRRGGGNGAGRHQAPASQ